MSGLNWFLSLISLISFALANVYIGLKKVAIDLDKDVVSEIEGWLAVAYRSFGLNVHALLVKLL